VIETNQVKALASGTFYLALMNATQYATAFVFYIVVARVLSPSEVGSFSLLFMIMTIFNTLTLLALNNAVTKYVAESLGRGNEEEAWACSKKAFKLMLGVSLPSLALALSISPIFSSYAEVGSLEVSLILVSAFALDLINYYGAVMYGYCMFKQVAIQNILFTLSSRFLALLLASLGLKVLGLSLGFLIGSLATIIFSLVVLRGKTRSSSKDFPSSKLLNFSAPIYGANVIGLLQSWLDVAVLSSVAGLGVTGTYYIAASSVAPLSVLWIPLSSALFPVLSWMNGSGYEEQVLEVRKRTLRVATAIVLPLSVALASVSRTALFVVYGSAYAEASVPFAILALSSILSAYASIYGAELQALGRTRTIFVAGVASTAAYVLLLATITKSLGQVGAAVARVTMVTVCFLILHRRLGAKAPENLKRSAIAATITASALAPIEIFLRTDVYSKAFIEVLAFVIAMPIAFKLTKPLENGEVKLLKSAISWLSRHYRSVGVDSDDRR